MSSDRTGWPDDAAQLVEQRRRERADLILAFIPTGTQYDRAQIEWARWLLFAGCGEGYPPGSHWSALVDALITADPHNRERLIAAYPEAREPAAALFRGDYETLRVIAQLPAGRE